MRRRVLFLTISDHRGASSRYRVYQYLPGLDAAGFDTKVIPPGERGPSLTRPFRRIREESRLLRAAKDADLIYIQRRLFSTWFIERLLRLRRPLVFDFDDSIFTSPRGNWSAVTKTRVIARLAKVLRGSSLVVAGNRYLAEFAKAYARHVEILPTAIDLSRYQKKASKRSNGLTLGWIGNEVNQRYLDLLRGLLLALAEELADLRLVVVSDRDYGTPGVMVENRRWSERTEVDDLLSFDIGLMPLEKNEWTLGKCALKALQYMAASVPAVCSAVGANQEIIDNGVDGFLCGSESDWREAITCLASDPSLRATIGTRGRAKVERSYSTEKVSGQLVKLLLSLG